MSWEHNSNFRFTINPWINTVALLKAVGLQGKTFLQSVALVLAKAVMKKALFCYIANMLDMIEKKAFLSKYRNLF